ncbi:MAG: META domain-containing protein [Rhodoplanes sp.]|uniref:META domain-containing protein n=1 Tax=Rhodoplanes sp. TaxID=1968906 RepID=UPI001853A598|nr:META domain-containing protein [Rhodoplanes sp.]NVO17359.1 META domain-containing protein [Rhodoplanes sp.]
MIRPCAVPLRLATGGGRGACALALVLAASLGLAAGGVRQAVAQDGFPYGQELRMDAEPMKGSKKIPVLDIADTGLADIELWCNAVKARLVVAADTITVLTGPRTDRSCPPERARGDEEVLAALNQATHWKVVDDALVLSGGPATLRFRMQRN